MLMEEGREGAADAQRTESLADVDDAAEIFKSAHFGHIYIYLPICLPLSTHTHARTHAHTHTHTQSSCRWWRNTHTHTHTHTHNHLAGGGDGHVPISFGGATSQGCLHTAAVRWGVRVQGCEEGAQRRGNGEWGTGRRRDEDGSLGALHQLLGVSVAPGEEP